MSYARLMVHMELGVANEGLLRIAGDLAERFAADAIGIVACQPMQVFAGDAYISGDLIEQDRLATDRMIKEAEQRFRDGLKGRAKALEWRSMLAFAALADSIAREARGADLFVISADGSESALDASRRVSVGDLALSLGRPVLVAPQNATALDLDHVMIGWKDSREARRAAADAIPLLKMSRQTTVVAVVKDDELDAARDQVEEVANWLRRHGVAAQGQAVAAAGNDSGQLAALMQEKKAGLLVAGAYGHSRVREWALGGVTRDLLLRSSTPSLVSH